MKQNASQQIALERIYRLFELAEKEIEKNPERSKRYVEIALELQKKHRIRWPTELKTKFCKKCKTIFSGKNFEKTKKGTIIVIKCLECGNERKTGTKKNIK